MLRESGKIGEGGKGMKEITYTIQRLIGSHGWCDLEEYDSLEEAKNRKDQLVSSGMLGLRLVEKITEVME